MTFAEFPPIAVVVLVAAMFFGHHAKTFEKLVNQPAVTWPAASQRVGGSEGRMFFYLQHNPHRSGGKLTKEKGPSVPSSRSQFRSSPSQP